MLQEAAQAVIAATSIAIAAPPPTPAREETPDTIVVTASRTADAMPVTVVEREEIERRAAVSLLEVLNDVPGMRAFSTGGIGGGSFVSVRGGEPNFTAVMLDGIKLNNPTNSRGGAFDFLAIDPSLVERIEVARGAVSAVHGSDALSGVINIDLRSASGAGTALTAQAQAGSEGDVGLGAGLRSGWGSGGVLVAGSWFDSNGLDPGSTLNRRQGLVRLEQRVGGYALRMLGLYGDADRAAFPEDSGGPLLAVLRDRETGRSELRTIGASLRRSEGVVRPNVSVSYSHQRDLADTPAIAPGVLDAVPALTADSRFSRLEAIGDVAVEQGPVAVTMGAALLRESGRSDGTIDFGFPMPVRFDLDRTTHSGFAEASLRAAPGLSLNAAGRYDHVSGGKGVWTGRAGVHYRPATGGAGFFAGIGEGYKLPSFYALGHPLVGNPGLRPERSTNVEAGAEWLAGDGDLLRITVFSNRFRDLIDFDPVLFTTVNRDTVRARGVELEGKWRPLPALDLNGALTWLDLDSPTPLRGRPHWQGSVRAVWRAADGLELNGAVRGNASFYDSSVPTGLVTTRGHAEADLGLRYRLSRQLHFGAALRNLTDSRHQDAVGVPAVGRQLRASLSAEVF